MKIKVCLAGASGWVGRHLAPAIHDADDLELVGAVSRSHHGRRLGEVLDDSRLDLTVSGSVAEALDARPDVLVDYTRADAVKGHTLAAIDRRVHVVIGTSGLTDEDYFEIDERARGAGVGVIAVGNFALSSVLMQLFAVIAAQHISHWEILDYADATKIDAPSGTTRELAHRLSRVRKPVNLHPIEETHGLKESRGATVLDSQIHSIRLPGYVIASEIIFGLPNERLTIRYEAGGGAEPYIAGTLLAVRKVSSLVGLHRGLDRVMEL
jgi:4-hydroxy-tetrahydrodipicolinate reductase